jgi:hypothetical protein
MHPPLGHRVGLAALPLLQLPMAGRIHHDPRRLNARIRKLISNELPNVVNASCVLRFQNPYDGSMRLEKRNVIFFTAWLLARWIEFFLTAPQQQQRMRRDRDLNAKRDDEP